jgi:hypothetical protein
MTGYKGMDMRIPFEIPARNGFYSKKGQISDYHKEKPLIPS